MLVATQPAESLLALRTEMGAPLRHHCFDNQRPTAHAGLIGTVVRHEIILLRAFGAITITVITQRTPTIGQGLAQHRLDGVEQQRCLGRRHLIGRQLGVDLGAPQGLVGINFAYPRQYRLV